jgi:hypothetical protein
LARAMKLALDAWSAGKMPAKEEGFNEMPSAEVLREYRAEELKHATIEACVLERSGAAAIRYRALAGEEVKELAA